MLGCCEVSLTHGHDGHDDHDCVSKSALRSYRRVHLEIEIFAIAAAVPHLFPSSLFTSIDNHQFGVLEPQEIQSYVALQV